MGDTLHTAITEDQIRAQFPTLAVNVNGKKLVYLDNGATSQKPLSVIRALEKYYSEQNANIHRGVHTLSQEATSLFEETRKEVQRFINAEHEYECIFTSGTTQGINLVAFSFGKQFVKPGDEVIISALEHHSNIVPWQMMCEDRGAILKVIPMTTSGELDLNFLPKIVSDKTRIIAVSHVSNALGTINPVREIISFAREKNIPVLLDGAQAVQHMEVNVRDLDCDFYVFSAHKMFGPTGVGVLYGKEKWLNAMPPFMGGGDMIKTVTFEKTEYNELPHKFEAGTPNIGDVIAFAESIRYIQNIGMDLIANREQELLEYATEQLGAIEGLTIFGTASEKAGVVSFNIEGLHPYDVGTILDQQGIAVRTGHHCTQPIMDFYKIPGTVRASFAFYNTKGEIDLLVAGVQKAIRMLKR